MDNWNTNQEPDVSTGGQFSGADGYQDQNNGGNPYQDQSNGGNPYQNQSSGGNLYQDQSNNSGNPYQSQNNNSGNPYQNNSNGNAYANQNTYGQNMYGQPQNNYTGGYGQPYANYNQQSYQGPGYTPTEKEEPVGMGEWVGLLVLANFVPCIGVILMIVWAFGNTEKKSKSNFCKAFLIVWLIKVAVSALLFIIWGASLASIISDF